MAHHPSRVLTTKQLLLVLAIFAGVVGGGILMWNLWVSDSEKNNTINPTQEQLLQRLKRQMNHFIMRLSMDHGPNADVQRLVDRYRKTEFKMSAFPESYTLNKGERVSICLQDWKRETPSDRDFNLLVFVALHELGHIMSVSEQHTPEFWKNFKFLLQEATRYGMYDPVDYQKEPAFHCNVVVNENPYWEKPNQQRS